MSTTPPAYCRYRKVYARVKIDGRNIHLGRYDSPETKAKYKRLIAEWAAGQSAEPDEPEGVSVAELLEQYRCYAKVYFGDEPRKAFAA